jgi:hypothetical protein
MRARPSTQKMAKNSPGQARPGFRSVSALFAGAATPSWFALSAASNQRVRGLPALTSCQALRVSLKSRDTRGTR